MEEAKIKHLEMIQSVITRMASNSFMLKGWSVTLVAALFALAAKDTDSRYVIVSYLPVLMFWALDSYYLYQERLFRKLYDNMISNTDHTLIFSMNTSGLKGGTLSWDSALFSKTIIAFHGILLITVIAVMFYLGKKA
jgi:hypothetical protein